MKSIDTTLDQTRLNQTKLAYALKRVLDSVFAAVAIVLLFPLFALVSAIVYFSIGKPVLFKQERPGKHGRIFKFYKFRTMTDQRDASGALLPDAQRLTPTGQFLRTASLDELPQLFNILKGEMSFVGPRPLLVEYLPLYSKEQSRRHSVTPGISGWVQVNGRNSLSWEEKFQLDTWYVDNWSLWLDLKIIFMTFFKVVKREGISQEGHVTMPRFEGQRLARQQTARQQAVR